MTSQRIQPGTVKGIVACAFSLWSFMLVGPIGISQATAGKNEAQTIVAWPEKGLGLSIDLTGFKKDTDQVKPDGRRYLMASHPKTGLNVSVTLEKVSGQASAKGCVEHLRQLQKGPFVTRGQEINLNPAGEMPTLDGRFARSSSDAFFRKNAATSVGSNPLSGLLARAVPIAASFIASAAASTSCAQKPRPLSLRVFDGRCS